MKERHDFDLELHIALRKGLGPRSERPYGAQVFGQLAKIIYIQLGREDARRFFRCALVAAHREVEHHSRLDLPGRHLSDTLTEEFGSEANVRIDAAWSIFQAAQNIAGKEQAALVSRCVIAALEADLTPVG
ncbi:hypothetical protein [Streptomyces sp. NRRL F-5135]|uniref:hypothetical protein n=1 Tax=Streptomyces sp. NRRL F-5135 TaxID=1463858 RepID=UPI0004C993A9|nr:hypothetical protein [Streptomyces sp. NRRL F-5135]